MRLGRMAALASAIVLAAMPELGAQQAGTIELGVLARGTRFDESNDLDPQIGVGGMLAVLIARHVALEVTASYAKGPSTRAGGPEVSYVPVTLALVRRDSLSPRTDLVFGAGLVRSQYGLAYDGHEFGVSGIVGARWLLTQWLALRGDVITDFMTSPVNGSTADFNVSLRLGGSVQLTRVPPPDGDFDGVPDRLDRCPDTSSDIDVDRNGCALPPDEDLDTVPDAEDRCPRTPFGEPVDRFGCPRPAQRPPPTTRR